MQKLLPICVLFFAVVCILVRNGSSCSRGDGQARSAGVVGAVLPLPDSQPTECTEIAKLNSLVQFFERSRRWAVLVEVGDMYARGCFPFYGTDPSTACRVYRVASRCPDRLVAAVAMSRLSDARLNPISPRDSAGPPLPPRFASKILRHAEYHIQRCPPSFQRVRPQPPARQSPTQSPRPSPPRPSPPRPSPVVALDKQNVHDHAVSRQTKRNAKEILRSLGEKNSDHVELIDSVMSELRAVGRLSEEDLAAAFRVLVSLVPDKIESIGSRSQLDVLCAVRAKLDQVEDSVLKKNLFETLGKNLASGIENGLVVCSTGKIARIVSTLEGTDFLEHKAVPIDTVRREIGTLSSKIRSDVLADLSPAEVDDYNSSPPGPVSPASSRMRERLEEEVDKTYVRELGLSSQVLQPIVAMYSREF